jgi:(1->4)-alpha-D-glucan 1-alpha-D-glucosylmutase
MDELLAAVRDALARGEWVSRRPASTYRLQLHAGFGLDAAAAIVPYLHDLGVTDLYLSPILASVPGSTHGYDVVDHGRIDPELGGEEAYDRLAAACAERGMGILLDFVPNHMGIGRWNAWWMDVLENGPSSVYAPYFDVDWEPVKSELRHRVLVPVLGDQFGVVLERGELKLERAAGRLVIRYFDHCFPVAPRSVPIVLRHRLDELKAELGATDPHVQELESICTALEKLAPRTETSPEAVAERAREKEVAKRRLAALAEASPRVRDFLGENVRLVNGRPGDPRSFDLLARLLEGQAYRLAFWRVAGEEINYRRFFDVNGLAAIRMEDPRVFQAAHALVLRLLAAGKATGLRIDHPDGLYAPGAYFRRLQASWILERARALAEARGAPLAADDEDRLRDRVFRELEAGTLPARPLYVVVEKILVASERMPEGWDVDGTTGYEFLAAVNGLFVEREHARAFDAIYARFTGKREDFREVISEKKRLVLSSSMASEVNVLAHRLNRISETNRRTRDFTLNQLTRALVEYVSLFPVYRTYVTRRGEIDERDRAYVESTIARARRRHPTVDPSVYDFLRDVLLLRFPDGLSEDERQAWLEFTLKLQQVTGPVTAKAVEDTAFYTYTRLASLNEVGGEPRRFGATREEVHTLLQERIGRWPGSLSTTSTHDTKRSEDVRVRIDAVSEVPEEWRATVLRWSRTNRAHLARDNGSTAPDRTDELLLYQTLVGAWPDGGPAGDAARKDFLSRIQSYMEKATREAKVHTSWTAPNEQYESGVRGFVERILASPAFVEDLSAFAARAARAGRLSSLAQVAAKCAAPGVPDVYQGCELWDLSLVDPDNRRTVDFDRRRALLAEISEAVERGPEARAAFARDVSRPEALPDGRAKLLLLREGLRLRRAERELLQSGEYWPLGAEGPHARNVFAFARVRERGVVLAIVPRLVMRLLDAGGGRIPWGGEIALPHGLPRRYRDVVTGERHEGDRLPLATLFGTFPVALLRSE